MKKAILVILSALLAIPSWSQTYERRDSLDAAVLVTRQSGNFISKGKDIRTEVISSAGLQKMACCSLADSFENSASVVVGYSDAITGARQIRLLGLSGTYTQMLDETRPVMRGLAAPFGLSYVPSPWLESIQIAKGAASVVNGAEAITGSINMEHKKPTDEIPLFINSSVMNDTKTDFNVVSSLQMGEHWSTVIFGHVSGNFETMDMNGDGFAEDPKQLQFNVGNRWLYYSPDVQIRFGVRAIKDNRTGGQIDHHGKAISSDAWTSSIDNKSLNAYLKIGKSIGGTGSIAMVADYGFHKMGSDYGQNPLSYLTTLYNADQQSAYLNLLYQNSFSDSHSLTAGFSGTADFYDESFSRDVQQFSGVNSPLANAGVYGEYTFRSGDALSIITGIRADWYSGSGIKLIPRVNIRYVPNSSLVFRASSGRGLRFSTPLIDNIGVMSTNKQFVGDIMGHTLEDAWTSGANLTWYIGGSSSNYFSLDYFNSSFNEQVIADYDSASSISFYNLSSLNGGRSFTNSYQADLSFEPVERFTVSTTFRYTDARVTLAGKGLVEKPMTSRYKGVLNIQYALPMNKWIFDFTASVNGPSKVYDFMTGYKDGLSPVYPLFYAQVTKRFKGFDIYAGGENLSGFRQKDVIISSPDSPDFDASCVWGPIMGAKIYAGIRITIWKTI